tara:strand:- start:8432 stop:9148 length:717 start_codon:yes stop_codon:yes gene_type:complete
MNKEKNKTPFFAFYPADFIMNTSRLSDEMVGKYIRLLCDQWVNGSLEMDQVPQALAKYYTEAPGNMFYNERLEEERIKALRIWNQRKGASDAAAKKRSTTPDGPPDGLPNDPPNQNQNQNKKKNKNKSENKKQIVTTKEVVLPWSSPQFLKVWETWKQYKAGEHRFKFKTVISEQAALTKLWNESQGAEDLAIFMVFNAIASQWKGIFPLKDQELKKFNNKKGQNDEQFNEIRERYGL